MGDMMIMVVSLFKIEILTIVTLWIDCFHAKTFPGFYA